MALATDSERHWQTAAGIMADAARDIGADGTIADELARKGRALHYHAFAAMPLVVLAELAAARGLDWYGIGDGALHRLVKVTAEGLAEPRLFEARVGVAQDGKTSPGAGWQQLYRARFPERAGAGLASDAEGHRWLGGSVTVLAEALRARR